MTREEIIQELEAKLGRQLDTEWNPTENIADAWDVVEGMRLKGWHVLVNGNPPGTERKDWPAPCHTCFSVPGVTYPGDPMIFHGYADTFPMAICAAAIKLLERLGPVAPPAPSVTGWREPGGESNI